MADEVGDREHLCRRCGVCCHQKVRFGEVVVITDVPCEFLDMADCGATFCQVYCDRFSRQPLCSTAEVSAGLGALPADCPYVEGVPDYPAPVMLRDHPEYEAAVNALFPGRAAATRVNVKALRYGRGKKRP